MGHQTGIGALFGILVALGGCGGGGDTTIIERERVVTQTVPEPAPTVPDETPDKQRVLGQVVLSPLRGERGVGIALVSERNGAATLVVQARDLKPTASGEAYEVWLYNSVDDARSMGAQLTDNRGRYQGAGELPADYESYEFIDVSRERVDQDAAHGGRSVLRGRIDSIQ